MQFKVTETFSQISIIDTFVVTFKCVRGINMLNSLPLTVYEIPEPSTKINFPAYTLINDKTTGTCPDQLHVTSVTLSNGDPLPSTITYSGGPTARFVSVYESDQMNRNKDFRVKVTVHDPLTLVSDNTLEFDVRIQCTRYVGYCYPPCALTSSPVNWITSPTLPMDFAIRPDAPETFHVLWPEFVEDATNCAHV